MGDFFFQLKDHSQINLWFFIIAMLVNCSDPFLHLVLFYRKNSVTALKHFKKGEKKTLSLFFCTFSSEQWPQECILLHSCKYCVHATVYSAFCIMCYVLNILANCQSQIYLKTANSMECMGYNMLSCSLIINNVFSAPFSCSLIVLFLSTLSFSFHLPPLPLVLSSSFPSPSLSFPSSFLLLSQR